MSIDNGESEESFILTVTKNLRDISKREEMIQKLMESDESVLERYDLDLVQLCLNDIQTLHQLFLFLCKMSNPKDIFFEVLSRFHQLVESDINTSTLLLEGLQYIVDRMPSLFSPLRDVVVLFSSFLSDTFDCFENGKVANSTTELMKCANEFSLFLLHFSGKGKCDVRVSYCVIHGALMLLDVLLSVEYSPQLQNLLNSLYKSFLNVGFDSEEIVFYELKRDVLERLLEFEVTCSALRSRADVMKEFTSTHPGYLFDSPRAGIGFFCHEVFVTSIWVDCFPQVFSPMNIFRGILPLIPHMLLFREQPFSLDMSLEPIRRGLALLKYLVNSVSSIDDDVDDDATINTSHFQFLQSLITCMSQCPDKDLRYHSYELLRDIFHLYSSHTYRFELYKMCISRCPFPNAQSVILGMMKDEIDHATLGGDPSPFASSEVVQFLIETLEESIASSHYSQDVVLASLNTLLFLLLRESENDDNVRRTNVWSRTTDWKRIVQNIKQCLETQGAKLPDLEQLMKKEIVISTISRIEDVMNNYSCA